MIEWLKRLLWDQAAFTRYARAFFITTGTTLAGSGAGGLLPPFMLHVADPVTWVFLGAFLNGFGGLMGAGDPNMTMTELKAEDKVAKAAVKAADLVTKEEAAEAKMLVEKKP